MGLKEIGWEGVDWVQLVRDRNQWRALVNMLNKPWDSIKCGKFLD